MWLGGGECILLSLSALFCPTLHHPFNPMLPKGLQGIRWVLDSCCFHHWRYLLPYWMVGSIYWRYLLLLYCRGEGRHRGIAKCGGRGQGWSLGGWWGLLGWEWGVHSGVISKGTVQWVVGVLNVYSCQGIKGHWEGGGGYQGISRGAVTGVGVGFSYGGPAPSIPRHPIHDLLPYSAIILLVCVDSIKMISIAQQAQT